MDRIIQKKRWTLKKGVLLLAAVLLLLIVFYQFLFADRRQALTVEPSQLSISTVYEGSFNEFVVRTGNILPKNSYYLDAVEGGIVSQRYKESGAMVTEGDLILSFANAGLQLDVANREAQLFEQLNNLRNSRMALEQNSLSLQAQLAEIDYQLQLLQPEMQRNEALFADQLISEQDYQNTKKQLQYNQKRRKLTYASFRQDSILRQVQLLQLAASEKRITENLEMIGNLLKNLEVRAPANGQLSMPDLELGQSISSGQRLGQIDELGAYKIRVSIDEMYLPQVNLGQQASYVHNDKSYRARVMKIYPTVINGSFEVDLDFEGEQPQQLRSGQSVRLRMELGGADKALLLPTGAFYQHTGGNWIFVLDESGKTAHRRFIKLGRKNINAYEVLEGLKAGEKVITSSYEYFGNSQLLNL